MGARDARDSLALSDKNVITETDDDRRISNISQLKLKDNYVMGYNNNDNSAVQIGSHKELSDNRSSNAM